MDYQGLHTVQGKHHYNGRLFEVLDQEGIKYKKYGQLYKLYYATGRR